LRREWLRSDEAVIPSENEVVHQQQLTKKKKNEVIIAPCLAKEELIRLRKIGMHLKEKKISIPKSGLTRPVLHRIHHQWKNNELVKLKFHDLLAHNMNLAHLIVQVHFILLNYHHRVFLSINTMLPSDYGYMLFSFVSY
jgi:RNA-binding protein YhbY